MNESERLTKMTVWCTSQTEAEERLADLLLEGWAGGFCTCQDLWRITVVRPFGQRPIDEYGRFRPSEPSQERGFIR